MITAELEEYERTMEKGPEMDCKNACDRGFERVESRSCDGRRWCGPHLRGSYVHYTGVLLT